MSRREGITRVLKEQEFQEVIAYTRANSYAPLRDIAILQASYRCGLRAGEIAKLNLEDILDSSGNIKEQVTLRKKTTKGQKGGIAYFTHPELREALENYIVVNRSKKSTPFNSVFISKKLTPFHPASMSRLFSKLYKDAGFEGATGHQGRKALAFKLNAQNVNLYNISRILRHSSVQTTAKYYLDVDTDTLADIVGKV